MIKKKKDARMLEDTLLCMSYVRVWESIIETEYIPENKIVLICRPLLPQHHIFYVNVIIAIPLPPSLPPPSFLKSSLFSYSPLPSSFLVSSVIVLPSGNKTGSPSL